jgi:hypothetical protein
MQIDSLQYSIPYVILVLWFGLLFIAEYLVKRQETGLSQNLNVIRWASLGSLLLFFGLRGFIGWDWTIYYPAFKEIPSLFSFKQGLYTATRFDYGFVTYMAMVKSVWNNYNFFIFVNTLLDLIILTAFLRQFSRYSFSLSCLVFVIMGGFYFETDILRSAKAILLFILSIKYIYERKLVPFLLITFTAILFHISAVLYLPLYFILHRKISKRTILIIFICGLAVFLLQVEYVRPFLLWFASLLGEKFTLLLEKYLQIAAYSSAYGITIGLLERIITASLIIIYFDKLIRKDSFNRVFINTYLIYFIIFFYFAEIKIIPFRVGGMLSFAYWILYPALLTIIEKRNNRIIFIVCFFAYSLIKIAGMTDTVLYRYTNFLFGADDFSSRLKIFESVQDILMR